MPYGLVSIARMMNNYLTMKREILLVKKVNSLVNFTRCGSKFIFFIHEITFKPMDLFSLSHSQLQLLSVSNLKQSCCFLIIKFLAEES